MILFFFFLSFLRLGVQGFAETGSEDVIVPRVNAEVNYAHALQSTVNVIQIFVEIVGLGNLN